jgi:hypothetical protein
MMNGVARCWSMSLHGKRRRPSADVTPRPTDYISNAEELP